MHKKFIFFSSKMLFIFCLATIFPFINCTAAYSFVLKPAPTIYTVTTSGSITGCVGTASVSPNVERFTVSGSGLSSNITATAPAGFEISLTAGSGYGTSLTIAQSGGAVSFTLIYVRSSAMAPVGNISGNVVLSSTGATSQDVAVSGTVNALPTINAIANQTVANGVATAPVYFTGTGSNFNWVNNTPSIGLAASGVGNIASFTYLNAGNSPVTAIITATPVSPAFAYIVQGNISTNVTVVNMATEAIVAQIPVGVDPYGVSVSPDGTKVYVANYSSSTVSVISTATNTVIATVTVGEAPNGLTVSPDGSRLYVTGDASVTVVNTLTNTVLSTIGVRLNSSGIAVSPDGSKVYIANGGSNTVSVLNTASEAITATINVGNSPDGITVSPDGSRVYVANSANSSVMVINTSTNIVASTITVGQGPSGLAIRPDGTRVYVANEGPNTVSVINTLTNAVIATIPVGAGPNGVSVSTDGSRVYVANSSSNTISEINTATNSVVATIPAVSYPSSFGNFTTGGTTGCSGISTTFTITVNPGAVPTPLITGTGTLTALNTIQGTASASTSFSLSGADMKAGILVTPPPGFEVSIDNSNFSNTVTVGTAGSKIASTTVYIRLAASTAVGTYSGNIVLSSTGAVNVNVPTIQSTVIPPPIITGTPVTGNIYTCAGPASASPNIQQFTVSGSGLTANISITAPTGFEVSLAAGTGYGKNVTLNQLGGTVNASAVYVRSAASAPSGNISGNVVLTSAGATSLNILVKATINALPTVNTVSNQTVISGGATTAINFTGSGNTFNWVNNTPAIGLAASGTGNIPSFTALNNSGLPVIATISVTPVNSSYLYIPNGTDNNVSVISATTNSVIATIPVGQSPYGVATSLDGTHVYVTNSSSNSVSAINTASKTVIATITVGTHPLGVSISPDGSTLYVANAGSNNVSVINSATNSVAATIPTGSYPVGVSVSPDGSSVYVANSSSNSVSVINSKTNTVVSTIMVGNAPFGIAVSPDGSTVYAINSSDGNVSVINTATNQLVSTVTVGLEPTTISFSPSGSRAYVANRGANSISVINTATKTVVTTINVAQYPSGTTVSPDGSLLYVAQDILAPNNISVINTTTNTVINLVSAGNSPTSFGNFISGGIGCSNAAVRFTVTVDPGQTIVTGAVTGGTVGCAGTASSGTNIQQFTVSGSGLSANVNVSASAGFEISLAQGSGYGSLLTLPQSGGIVNNTVIYVRSAASAAPGNISGSIVLSSAGAISRNVAISFTINGFAPVNAISNQIVNNGFTTAAINFTGPINNTYNWVNSAPGIGLAASGTGNIPPFTAANTGNSAVTANITVTPVPPTEFAYIANYNDNTVSVINTATNTVTATIPVGVNPFGVCVSPDGTRVYVTNQNASGFSASNISVINTYTNKVISTIPVGVGPIGICISPDASKLYVVNGNSQDISVINTATETIEATIVLGSIPVSICISPDGSRVYVVNDVSGTVSEINTATNTIIATITLANGIRDIIISPDGSTLYVSNFVTDKISVIGTANNTVIATLYVGNGSYGLAISPDGSRLYEAEQSSNVVNVLNTSTLKFIASIPTGSESTTVAVSPDGSRAYVTNFQSNNVAVINTATNKIIAQIPVGSGPSSLGNFIADISTCNGGTPSTFTITVNPTTTLPTIYENGSLSALTTISGTASSSTSFIVSGANLTAGILVTPPTGFEVSTDNINFGNTVTFGASGNVASATVYIRLAAATAVGTYSGNIVLSSAGATSISVATVSSTVVAPPPAVITVGTVAGVISACAGTASVEPNIDQFTVSGSNLSANIIAAAPTGFEVSLTSGSGYGNNITLTQSGGTVNSTVLYIRSASSAPPGSISGNIVLTSTGATSLNVGITGNINALPTVNGIANQTVLNGKATAAINFTGTASIFNWINDTPGVGLRASGSGDIASFNAVNTSSSPITATITVTPMSSGGTGCNGIPVTFTITVNPGSSIAPAINASGTLSPLLTVQGTASFSTSFSVSGTNLTAGILVTPPTGFEVSTDNATFSSAVTVGAAGNTASTPVYVRLAAVTPAGTYSGNIVLSSAGAVNVNVATASSIVNPTGSQAIISASGTLPALSTTYGTASSSASFTVSGNNLTAGILISLPAGFEVSTDNSTFSSTLTVGAAGAIASTTVYIRLAATAAAGSYSGNIVLSSSGAPSVNIATVNSSVAKALLTITADDQTRQYGLANPVFTISYNRFVNGETVASLTTPPTATTTATTTSDAGTYPITAAGAVAANYTFSYLNGTLTITTASRTITFNAIPTKTYGDPDFDAGATASDGEAIVYSIDNPAVATIVNGMIHITGAGSANITATVATSSNYTTTPSVSETLVVDKANQTITLGTIPTLLTGTTYDLSGITASSGLPVTFTVSDPLVAPVAGQTLNALSIGTIILTVSQAGDTNYNAVSITAIIVIRDAGNDEIKVHQEVSPNGDGINDFLLIEGIQNYPTNTVTMYNRNGVKIFQIDGYDNSSHVFDGHSNVTGALQQAGTYFYVVEYSVDSVVKRKTGYIVLKYN